MQLVKDWISALGKILFRPSPQTFLDIAQDSNGKMPSAIVWLLFTVVYLYAIVFARTGRFDIPGFLLVLVIIPLGVLLWVFWINLLHQKLFRRRCDYYNELLYAIVCIFTVFSLLNAPMVFLDKIGEYLGWGLALYQLALIIVAVQAITALKLWQSLITVFLGSCLAAGSFVCLAFFIPSLIHTVPPLFSTLP